LQQLVEDHLSPQVLDQINNAKIAAESAATTTQTNTQENQLVSLESSVDVKVEDDTNNVVVPVSLQPESVSIPNTESELFPVAV
jgi:hypothetical protein